MKHRLKSFIIFVVLMILFSGCVSYSSRAIYDIGLKEVERPVQAKERYGEQKITKTNEEGVEKYYFEAALSGYVFAYRPSSVGFL